MEMGLAAAGVISFAAVAQAEEKPTHQVLTAVSSTTLSGYVSTSAIWRPGTDDAASQNKTRTYDGVTKQDGFNLDVINIKISKRLDESEWASGYVAELLVGPDTGVFQTGGSGGVQIKQAYVALNAPVGNGITFKMGVFDTPIGYEAYNYTDNPNYSRSIGWQLEPSTYTGLMASYKLCDAVSISAAVFNNPDASENINGRSNTESEKGYLAVLTVTAPDSFGFLKGSSLTAGVVDHDSAGGFGANTRNIVNWYVGATFNTPIEALKVGVAFDYVGISALTQVANADAYANATSIYLSYAVTEKLKVNTRAEYGSGSSDAPGGPFRDLAKAGDDKNSQFFSLTGTVDYALWANVVSRAEVRWDADVSGGPQSFGGAADEKHALTFAVNVIYKF